jgi:hypothetical protein
VQEAGERQVPLHGSPRSISPQMLDLALVALPIYVCSKLMTDSHIIRRVIPALVQKFVEMRGASARVCRQIVAEGAARPSPGAILIAATIPSPRKPALSSFS